MAPNTRILFVIDSLGYGGAERQLVELIKGLDCRGYEIYLASLIKSKTGYADIVSSLGIKICYFPRNQKYNLFGPVMAIARCIRSNHIDLVHGFMNMGSLFGALSAKWTGRPIVCSAIRDAKDTSLKEKYLEIFICQVSDFFVANSQAGFANRFREMKPHFRVVYNGVDFSRFESSNVDVSTLKEDLGLMEFDQVVGMVASLKKYKDHDTLLKAARKVIQFFPHTGFLFVGDGPYRNLLEEKVHTLGLQNHVVFAGYRKDVDQLYHILDICVLLTNSAIILEGTSNALIEAMAVGVPVVASEGGGTGEMVQNNITGILVPPKNSDATVDALIRLLNDRAEAERLSTQGREKVRNMFDLNRYVQEYEVLYEQLLNTNK